MSFISPVSSAWSSGHNGVIRIGIDLPGYPKPVGDTPQSCFDACFRESACQAWSFKSVECSHQSTNRTALCYLKHSLSKQKLHFSNISGCVCASGVKRAAKKGLLPLKFKTLTLGTVAPQGWLRNQLITMANGLSGHLDLFWNDVMDSVWVGGKSDHSGAGHERGPYWLNGMVPLAAQLNASGDITKLDIDLNAQVNHWIMYILDHQLKNGWLGPDDGFGGPGNTYWNGWNTAASLLQYANAQGSDTDIANRCNKAVLDYITEVHRRMLVTPTKSWSQNRWQDWVYIIHWLMDQDPQGQEQLLWDAAELTQQQSWDWDAYYDQTGIGRTGAYVGKNIPKFPETDVPTWTMYDHGVNNAMGTKSCAVWYRQSQNAPDWQATYKKLTMQHKWHGQPFGMFAGDECFGGRELNRGIELCAVVEQMYSLQYLFWVGGETQFLDMCERIAYNALPATITPDMWQHQYLQQANEINAKYGLKSHVWKTDGSDSTGFGVAPNFGCCTANMQQGWPKMVNNVILISSIDDGLVLGLIAPVKATYKNVSINVVTEYPFGDNVKVTVQGNTPLHIRIPAWATKAMVSINGGQHQSAKNGTLHTVACKGLTTILIEFNPTIYFEFGWGGYGIPVIPYSPTGGVVPTTANDFRFGGGSGLVPSKLTGLSDIRSGNPGEINTVTILRAVWGKGHFIHQLSLVYRYVAGYTPTPPTTKEGSQFSLVIVDYETHKDLHTVYTSPILDKYSFDNFKGYSPPIFVNVNNLHIDNTNAILLVLRFINNQRNLQILIEKDVGLNLTVHWNSQPMHVSVQSETLNTNAVSVLRGPLLYALHLEQNISTVRKWKPFDNVDSNIETHSPWNYALMLDKDHPMQFERVGSPDTHPWNTTHYPSFIHAFGKPLITWSEDTNAAPDPQPSPIDCKKSGNCGNETKIILVPYGATNIRMGALPWIP